MVLIALLEYARTGIYGLKPYGATTLRYQTMALADDPARNQVGAPGAALFQTIEMMLIRDRNKNSIVAYIYKGNSEELNSEAQAIIDSIQFVCAPET
jgi:hypothetical protein